MTRPPTPRETLALAAGFAVLTIVWILLRLPGAPAFLMDLDGGHQLAGALQILHGEHPFVDYDAMYGPLTFYASAVAQAASGRRLVGELVLTTAAFAAAYALLALLILRLTGRRCAAIVFGLLALMAIPRFYKYYLVLGPVATIWLLWRHLERPSRWSGFWAALAVTVTGLYRLDFGAYAALAGIVGVALHPGGSAAARARNAAVFAVRIALWALPWMLFLAWHGRLGALFRDLLLGAPRFAAGMSRALPTPRADLSVLDAHNLGVLMTVFFLAVPAAAAWRLYRQWRTLPTRDRARLASLIVLAQLSLLQSYRADVPHVLQSIPLAFVLLAWIATTVRSRVVVAAAVAGALLPAGLVAGSPNPVNARGLATRLRDHTRSHAEILAHTGGGLWYVEAMKYVRRCTTEEQRLLALPILTTFNYFTDRPFAGGRIGVAPGYFVTEADQERAIRRMSTQDIPLVVYWPNYEFDGRPESTLETIAPRIDAHIRERYVAVTDVGPVQLWMRKDLRLDAPAGVLARMPCPHP